METAKNQRGQKQATRRRGLYTPKAKQTRVIVASLAGQSKRQIAFAEHLKRDTVARILSQPEVQQLLEAYRQWALKLAPLCLKALQAKLLRSDGRLRDDVEWRMLVEILKGTQILVPRLLLSPV